MENELKQKLVNYTPSQTAIDLIRSTKILFLVGPTGAGKDTVKTALLKTGQYHHVISHTTRAPRLNHGELERDGVNYHFIDQSTALDMVNDHEFIEAKLVHGTHIYGTSLNEIRLAHNEHKIAVTDIEVQGVREYKAIDPNVTAVFLLPPDFNTWQTRLAKRYGQETNHSSEYKVRLQTALTELEEVLTTDYYQVIVNDHLDHTVQVITDIMAGRPQVNDTDSKELVECLIKDIKHYLA